MELKFMSFNARVAVSADGVNYFFNRTSRILDMIRAENPDYIGFQEITDGMRAWFRDNLEGYTVIGCGRERDCHGESMLIAYKTEGNEILSVDNKWLSFTPDLPGSTFGGDQSVCPRMYTKVVFKHDGCDRPFTFINTHLDHAGQNARYLGAVQLCRAVSDLGMPYVLTGDFNALPDAPEMRLLTATLPGGRDCSQGLGGTFHGFGRLTDGKKQKIDYVFTDMDYRDCRAVTDVPEDGVYYSDHEAVVTYISVP